MITSSPRAILWMLNFHPIPSLWFLTMKVITQSPWVLWDVGWSPKKCITVAVWQSLLPPIPEPPQIPNNKRHYLPPMKARGWEEGMFSFQKCWFNSPPPKMVTSSAIPQNLQKQDFSQHTLKQKNQDGRTCGLFMISTKCLLYILHTKDTQAQDLSGLWGKLSVWELRLKC